MIRHLYIVKRNGDVLYRRSYEGETSKETLEIPSFVKNSSVLFHSQSSVSSERAYTLEHNDDLWVYAFFHPFSLLALADRDQPLPPLKNMILSLGRAILRQLGNVAESWEGSIAEIVDLNDICDDYVALDLKPTRKSMVKKLHKIVNSALERPEIAFVGIFDSSGKMICGNVPDIHLFRLEVEITQGSIKPMVDIAPTSISTGEGKMQMLRVNSLTVVVAALPDESPLHAVGVIGEVAHQVNKILS
ncbi:MAG: hypothetical protein ACTSV3_02020 [Candidatus Thorarchaeota archaeon]|nr:MAG: hypothetical protein DRP09_04775 [Candidatus Thorarchaeota archaeon]RLI59455.1 MAG: hypothetical protein DRO87_02900 [Candidatus Thorarchaeota archaeon]